MGGDQSLIKGLSQRKAAFCGSLLGASLGCLLWFFFCLPDPLLEDPSAILLLDRNGKVLSARVAADEQWRFLSDAELPEKWVTAIITAEDKRFRRHLGVDPLALSRAMVQNVAEQRVVSGASTLTMQVIRLARKGRPRVLSEKIIEAIWAFRLEMRFCKDDILKLYANNAPFGGNTVGLTAASWRYFRRPPDELSWSEAALLAVLPNNPSWIHPGKQREKLKLKRDELLKKLLDLGHVDQASYELAIWEPLPMPPGSQPDLTPHAIEKLRIAKQGVQNASIDAFYQRESLAILQRYVNALAGNQVHNAAALIMDNRSGEILVYCGNVAAGLDHQPGVDLIHAPRSSGSVLKPLLHMAALDDGLILPKSLLFDVPSQFSGYHPQNFDLDYEGALSAEQSLARSRNVPAVKLLQLFGQDRFFHVLKRQGFGTLTFSADHYGLSLILGGAEVSLWDLVQTYSNWAKRLNGTEGNGFYNEMDKRSVYDTFQAMTRLERPESQGMWQLIASAPRVAWKTGTSFGFRDAWAVGLNPDFTVGVWVGNADGEGRPGLTGMAVAGPIMFELFGMLPPTNAWFKSPPGKPLVICSVSGWQAGMNCPTDTIHGSAKSYRAQKCEFHKRIFIEPKSGLRADKGCFPGPLVEKVVFNLPPDVETYFGPKHADYKPMPVYLESCKKEDANMALVYPQPNAKLILPADLDGTQNPVVFRAAHADWNVSLFWHLNGTFLAETRHPHRIPVWAMPGVHSITVVDQKGRRIERQFEVLPNAQQVAAR